MSMTIRISKVVSNVVLAGDAGVDNEAAKALDSVGGSSDDENEGPKTKRKYSTWDSNLAGSSHAKSLHPTSKPLPPFLQRLKKKAEDGKFQKCLSMLKELSMNIPLVEALEQMSGLSNS